MDSIKFYCQNTASKRPTLLLSLLLGVIVILMFNSLSILARTTFDTTTPRQWSQMETDIGGRYTGTLIVAAPANIGVTDLSIQLDAVGSTFAGAVLAAGTTHFAGEPAITASISGSTNGITPTFTIQAQPFVEMIAGQTVTRTFTIEGEVLDDGSILTGDYHETIMGYTQTPLQITGTVLLARIAVGVPQIPTTPTPNPPVDGNFNLYLPLINRDTNSISVSELLEAATPLADTPNEDQTKVYLPLITAD